MIEDHWPLFGLRLQTPRLELRLPDLDDLAQLAEAAAGGVHDPARQPFTTPWTDGTPAEAARSTLQWQWSRLGNWSPADWSLNLVTVAEGRVIGTQSLDAKQFAIRREAGTGSWLGLPWHGQGYGKEMRAAILALAFAGLGAEYATSEAFADNAASYGVSRALGYADNGITRHVVRGGVVEGRRLRLDRATWEATRTVEVKISGLEPCLPLFGI
jgi:RimJ/RimL family protein N-acetyltransferase